MRLGAQLLVDCVPLLDAIPVEEERLAETLVFAPGEMRALLLQVLPELEEGEEIRLLVAEGDVRLVGGLLIVERALARVLDAERRSDDRDLAQAVAVGRRYDVSLRWVSSYFALSLLVDASHPAPES